MGAHSTGHMPHHCRCVFQLDCRCIFQSTSALNLVGVARSLLPTFSYLAHAIITGLPLGNFSILTNAIGCFPVQSIGSMVSVARRLPVIATNVCFNVAVVSFESYFYFYLSASLFFIALDSWSLCCRLLPMLVYIERGRPEAVGNCC